MKKLILTLLLCVNIVLLKAQVETYSNYPFNGNNYNVFVVKMDGEALNKFDILQNDSIIPHQEFLSKLLNSDPSFFLINACISDTICRPIGYYSKNSKQIQASNMKDGNGNFYLKPNGALLFTTDDVILCESSLIGNYQNVRLGIQSGPMLLNNGVVNTQFKQNSANKKIRCGVGLFANGKGEKFLVFCISNDPVSFYDFAVFFNKKFKCSNALCLESVGCSMFFPNQANPNEKFNGTICNYIYFKL